MLTDASAGLAATNNKLTATSNLVTVLIHHLLSRRELNRSAKPIARRSANPDRQLLGFCKINPVEWVFPIPYTPFWLKRLPANFAMTGCPAPLSFPNQPMSKRIRLPNTSPAVLVGFPSIRYHRAHERR
jgi:hypothetical protein